MTFNDRDRALRIETDLQGPDWERNYRALATFTDGNTGLSRTLCGEWKDIEGARQELRDLHRIFETN